MKKSFVFRFVAAVFCALAFGPAPAQGAASPVIYPLTVSMRKDAVFSMGGKDDSAAVFDRLFCARFGTVASPDGKPISELPDDCLPFKCYRSSGAGFSLFNGPVLASALNAVKIWPVPKYFAFPADGGKLDVVKPDESGKLRAPAMSENWFLCWYGKETHLRSDIPYPALTFSGGRPYMINPTRYELLTRPVDCPFLIVTEQTPFEFQLPKNGESLDFNTIETALGEKDDAGYLVLAPIMGMAYPEAEYTETWVENGVPEDVVRRCRWWYEHLADYPTAGEQDVTVDWENDVVSLNYSYDFEHIGGERNGVMLAPLPRMLGVAVQTGCTLPEFDKPPVPSGTATGTGPVMGIPDADSFTCRLRGLRRYVESPGHAARPDVPAEARDKLARETRRFLDTKKRAAEPPAHDGELRPQFYLYEGNPAFPYLVFSLASAYLPQDMRVELMDFLSERWDAWSPLEHIEKLPDELNPKHHFYAKKHLIPIENFYAVNAFLDASGKAVTPDVVAQGAEMLGRYAARLQFHCLGLGKDADGYCWPYWIYGTGGVLDANRMFAGTLALVRMADAAGAEDVRDEAFGVFANICLARLAMGKYNGYLYASGIQKLPEDPERAWKTTLQVGATEIGHLWNRMWTAPEFDHRSLFLADDTQGVFLTDAPERGWMALCPFPFLDMVPELGAFLRDNLEKESRGFHSVFADIHPDWFSTFMVPRAGDEVAIAPPAVSFYHFLAHAWIFGTDANTLWRYLSISSEPGGDLYYIGKLAALLSAPRRGFAETP